MRRFLFDKVPMPNTDFRFEKARIFESVDLEIGSGAGRFAIRRALTHPERAVIAIEKTNQRFAAFSSRLQNHPKLPNLFALHANAVPVVTHLIPPSSIDNIFLLYPNPYPKHKHANLRWHNRAFMGFLLDRLKPNGNLTLATNMEYYRDEASAVMASTWHLEILEDRQIGWDEPPRTHFEKKYLSRDEPCWNLVFKRS